MRSKHLKGVVFGPQGSGKGTQGVLMAERLNIPIIGAGDLFRAEMAEKSTLGQLVTQYVNQGLLVPDELVNALMTRQLKRHDLSRGFILDGYPRNVEQATSLDRLLAINLVIQIKISDTEVVKRLSGRLQCVKCKSVYHETEAPPVKKGICSLCGEKLMRREDDKEDVIKQRLKAYHYMTAPLAGFYRQKGVLLVINGEQPIQYVFEDIMNKISKLGFVT
ncbi:MAG: nucleoside monophosphate kinase [Patescibacteria group bacterium]|nr:nucleoside monophosphate kinase [Patescibacteria group bacterium]